MKKLQPGILLTAITTILAFMSVLYISACDNKAPALSPYSCENIVCQNSGACNLGTCACPIGYQDSRCGTKWNTKFAGTWNVQEFVYASDTYDSVGNQRNYQVKIDTSATPTSIFITGLRGNGTYTDVQAIIDSTTVEFTIQQYSPVSNGNFNIKGGYTYPLFIKNGRDTIIGRYYTDYLNAQYLRERDSISFIMTK